MVLWKLGPRVHTEHALVSVSCPLPFPAEEDAGVSYEPGGETCIRSSATQKEGLSCLWPVGLLLDLASRQLDPAHPHLAPRSDCVGLRSFPPSPDCSPPAFEEHMLSRLRGCWALSLLGLGAARPQVRGFVHLLLPVLRCSPPSLELQPLPSMRGSPWPLP